MESKTPDEIFNRQKTHIYGHSIKIIQMKSLSILDDTDFKTNLPINLTCIRDEVQDETLIKVEYY